MKKVFSTP